MCSFRKVPADDSFLDSMIEAAELSSTRREVAVKTTCGHVIGKSEASAYVFKVSTKENIGINGSKIRGRDITLLKKFL